MLARRQLLVHHSLAVLQCLQFGFQLCIFVFSQTPLYHSYFLPYEPSFQFPPLFRLYPLYHLSQPATEKIILRRGFVFSD